MGDENTVTIFDKDGVARDIPQSLLKNALADGNKPAVRVRDPHGTVRMIPADRVPDLVGAPGSGKATMLPLEQQSHEIPALYGFTPANVARNLWQGAKGAVTWSADVAKDLAANPDWVYGHYDPATGEYKKSTMEKFVADPMAATAAQGAREMAVGEMEGDWKQKMSGKAKVVAGSVPIIGPAIAGLASQAGSGDVGGAAGQGAGAALAFKAGGHLVEEAKAADVPGSVKQLVREKAPAAGNRLYRTALKPSTGLKPAEARQVAQTGIDEGIPITEEGADKIASTIKDLHQQVRAKVATGEKTIAPGAVARRLDETKARFQNQAAPEEDVKAVEDVKRQFMDRFRAKDDEGQPVKGSAVRNMTPEEAQDLKEGTYRALSDRAYDEQKGARVEAEKAVARGLKEELEAQFPEIKGMNDRQSKLYDLEPELRRAVNRAANKDFFSTSTKLAAGAGTALGGWLGGAEGASVGGAAAAVMHKVLSDPGVKSKLAVAMSKLGGTGLKDASSEVKSYTQMLGEKAGALAGRLHYDEKGELQLPDPWANLKHDRAATDQALAEKEAGTLPEGMSVVQRAQQIKEGLLKQEKDGTISGGEKEPPDTEPFYSKSIKIAEEKLPEKFSTGQALATLRNAGAKQAELDWMGVPEFLKNNPKATKADLLGFMRDNQVRLGEVNLKSEGGSVENLHALTNELNQWYDQRGMEHVSADEALHEEKLTEPERDYLREFIDRWDAAADDRSPKGTAKYPGYVLPGEKSNYGEKLITLDTTKSSGTPKSIKDVFPVEHQLTEAELKEAGYDDDTAVAGGISYHTNQVDANQSHGQGWHILGTTDGKWIVPAPGDEYVFDTKAEAERKLLEVAHDVSGEEQFSPKGGPSYRSPHFDEPNILAHVRHDDRVFPDGKKALFLEEVQSDWHQQGKQRGYQGKPLQSGDDMAKAGWKWEARPDKHANGDTVWNLKDPQGNYVTYTYTWNNEPPSMSNAFDRVTRLQPEKLKGSGVPDAPFKQDWHELAMKRMLREAAEKGYDRLAWVTGEQTAERYDLSKQVDQVHYNPTQEHLSAWDKDNHKVVEKFGVKPEELADYIGKDAAKKLLDKHAEDPSMSNYVLENADLKVGGEWAKNLYDKAIVNFMNKYAKKWGGQVVDRELPGTRKPNFDVEEGPSPDPDAELGYYITAGRDEDGNALYLHRDARTNSHFLGSMEIDDFDPMSFPTERQAKAYIRTEGKRLQRELGMKDDSVKGEKVHTIDITPMMKKSVMKEGQPIARADTKGNGEEVA